MTDRVNEETFAATAINLGMVTEARIEECIKIQAEMREMGIEESLTSVLLKKGYLTQPQTTQVLRTMGVQIQPIPGYQIMGRLGAGGMGTVYKAKQSAMDRTVAIKVLSKQATQAKDFLGRFFREAQAAAKLNHPNIIQAYDAGCANNIYYFVMEFVDGKTARNVLEHGQRMPEKEALQFASQICEALDYIHKHGMVHRDIKPENIMITKEGVAKLCDFGLAKSTEVDSSITRSGITFGTPYYMSPEQINGAADVDIRADLYSLGASLFHLIAGRPVFDGKDLREVLTRHLTEEPPLASEVVPTVSDRTSRVIHKMLQKSRQSRYQTPRQVIDDIHQILRGGDPRFARRLRERSSSLAWMGVAAALIVVAGITGVAYVMNQPARPPALGPEATQPRPGPAPEVRPDPKPGPTPAPEVKPAPAPEIKPLDPRQVQAEGMWGAAKAAFELKNWEEARSKFSKLDQDFIDVPFVLERRKEIAEKIELCEIRLEEIARAKRAEADTQQVRNDYNAALNLFRQSKWSEARAAFTALLHKRLPEGVSPADLSGRIDKCALEIDAARGWDPVAALAKERKWTQLGEAVQTYTAAYRGTQAYTAHEKELREFEARTTRESAAAKAVEDLRAASDRGDVQTVVDSADAVAKAWGDTDAFSAAKDEIGRWIAAAREGLARPKEEQAQKAFESADAALKAENYDRAATELARLSEGDLADTQFAASKKSQIASKLAELEAGRGKAVETTAKNLYRTARQKFDKKEYEEALAAFKELQEKYPETKAVKPSAKAIADFVARCEREIHMTKASLIDDFEREDLKDSGWRKVDPAGFDLTGDRQVGRKALEINLGRHDRNPDGGGWPRVVKEMDEGSIPSETVAVTFWAKVGRPDVNGKVWVEVRTGEGPGAAIYAVEIAVTPKWKQYRVYLSSLKLIWGGDDLVRQRLRPPLDISKIRTFGFGLVNPSGELPIVVDDIRLEYYK